MKFYYSSKNPDDSGAILVHSDGCSNMPDILERVYLGIFPNGKLAISEARQNLQIQKLKACQFCCKEN